MSNLTTYTPKQKYEFSVPTENPTLFQRIKMDISRATNNLQRGFDGTLTPIQLGSLRYNKPLKKHEIIMCNLYHNKDIKGMLKETISQNMKANRIATKRFKLESLKDES